MRVCTTVTKNRLAMADVAARSSLEHHPDAPFTVLLLDGTAADAPERPYRVLGVRDLSLDSAELGRMGGALPIIGLVGAVKPLLMEHLLDEGAASVVHIDADMLVLGSFAHVGPLAEERGAVLTPHILAPTGADPERFIMLAGAYNGGFVAAGQRGRPFLRWWAERTRRRSIVAPLEGLHVEQRWLDLAPQLFDADILRDPTVNVMIHNAFDRDLRLEDGRVMTGDRPVSCFHYGGGFDPAAPLASDPRLADDAVLVHLYETYARRLLDAGYLEQRHAPPPMDVTGGGRKLDPAMRRAYREALIAAEEGVDSEPEPPSPFGTSGAFEAWLREPPDLRRRALGISRYLLAWRDELVELRARFADLPGADPGELAAAVLGLQADAAEDLFASSRAGAPAPPVDPDRLGFGVTLASDGATPQALDAHEALVAAGIPTLLVTYDAAQRHRNDAAAASGARYRTNLLFVAPDRMESFDYDTGVQFRPFRRQIAVWSEHRAPPPAGALAMVDEVWALGDEAAAFLAEHCGGVPVRRWPGARAAARLLAV